MKILNHKISAARQDRRGNEINYLFVIDEKDPIVIGIAVFIKDEKLENIIYCNLNIFHNLYSKYLIINLGKKKIKEVILEKEYVARIAETFLKDNTNKILKSIFEEVEH